MKKDHYYSFSIVLGNEDSHILPHPRQQDIKWIVYRLEELIDQLLSEYKCEWVIKENDPKA